MTILTQIGDWNPQLSRELRGRLKPRSVIAAVGLSLLGQFLVWLSWSQASRLTEAERWVGIWRTLTWGIPYVLLVMGAYFLMNDLLQEEKRGTLNFVRASPRPSRDVLIGKLLGVPILAYLAVVVAMPLHLLATFGAQVPLVFGFSYYPILGASALFIYGLAMLAALLAGSHSVTVGQQSVSAFAFAGLMFIFFTPMLMTWNFRVTWKWLALPDNDWAVLGKPVIWAYLPISENLLLSHGFLLGHLAIATVLVGWVLQRRFRIPRGTVLSKRQSYAIVAYVEVSTLGFLLQRQPSQTLLTQGAILLYVVNLVLFLSLIFSLSPQRQAILDWVRYRQGPQQQALIWADRAPAPVAVVVNLVIAVLAIGPWLFLEGVGAQAPVQAIMLLLSFAGIILIYAVLVQRILTSSLYNPLVWAVTTIFLIMTVVPFWLSIIRLGPDTELGLLLWVFLGYGFQEFDSLVVVPSAIAGLILQWLVLGGLTWQLYVHFKRLATA